MMWLFDRLYFITAGLLSLNQVYLSEDENGLIDCTRHDPICRQIVPKSDVFCPGTPEYAEDMYHWANSSMQAARCSVRPTTTKEVGQILNIIADTKTPFGIKGGGHTMNPGFSSTFGVLISMVNFNQVTYDAKSGTAIIGAGLVWDDVYRALAPYNVNVIGGRVSGIGVAGFTLSGGYSYKSNQYGLTVDNVVAFELVKPGGSAVNVSATSDPELFFGLKGGLNNFGIVTRFILKTYPQEQVWGGMTICTSDDFNNVTAATAKFAANVTDEKAAMMVAYNFARALNEAAPFVFLFYDAPTPPENIFDDFIDICDGSEAYKTRDYLELIQMPPVNLSSMHRGVFNTISLTNYTQEILEVIKNETIFWSDYFGKDAVLVSYEVEPFLPSLFSHNTTSSAYPPDRSRALVPLNIYYSWDDPSLDSVFYDAIHTSVGRIRYKAIKQGQAIQNAAVYPGYAIFDTPLAQMYGKNVRALRALKNKVDPLGIMDLAGGFRF